MTLRSALLGDFGSDEAKGELIKTLGIKLNSQNRRSTKSLNSAARKLGEEIKISDELDEQQEQKFIEILEKMVTGKIQTIGASESEALVSLRKEYFRRNIQINMMFQDLSRADQTLEKLEEENKKLEEAVYQFYEQKEYMYQQALKLKTLNEQSMDRACISEVKLYNSEVIREFGEAN